MSKSDALLISSLTQRLARNLKSEEMREWHWRNVIKYAHAPRFACPIGLWRLGKKCSEKLLSPGKNVGSRIIDSWSACFSRVKCPRTLTVVKPLFRWTGFLATSRFERRTTSGTTKRHKFHSWRRRDKRRGSRRSGRANKGFVVSQLDGR